MSTYFIGDVHGCYKELKQLLKKIQFNPDKDRVIFVGDLINRGPKSLQVLRYIRSLGASAQVVLGNHDISFIAYAVGVHHGKGSDFPEMMLAEDSWELIDWLRHQPLLIHDKKLNVIITHAGIPPRWTTKQAIKQAAKAEKKLCGYKFKKYLKKAYANSEDRWQSDYDKYDKFRYRLNGFTRLRFCDAQGEPNFTDKCGLGKQSAKFKSWFLIRKKNNMDGKTKIIFGHWAALGLHETPNAICLDSGCVWGGHLTAAKFSKKRLRYTRVRASRKK